MIRWWSLGSAWWERLSRSLTPIQCTKLIYVPPWEGFSPNSARLSIISSILDDKPGRSEVYLFLFPSVVLYCIGHLGGCLHGNVGKLPAPGITLKWFISCSWGQMCMPGGRSQARAASRHSLVVATS
jgi:hypothetical protein